MRTKSFAAALIILILLSSCTLSPGMRKVLILIPDHPWEISGRRLWYNLSWTDGHEVKNLYISQNERQITLSVPKGQTVLFCAYPLGDMNPFGGSVCPYDRNSTVELTQQEGIVISMLMDCDRDATMGLNMKGIMETAKTYLVQSGWEESDIEALDMSVFLRDMLNGELSRSSFMFRNRVPVQNASVPNGVWLSEMKKNAYVYVQDGTIDNLKLYPGVWRYYNREIDRELVVVVDTSGETFCYLRQGMM